MAEPYVPRNRVYRRNEHRFVLAALYCLWVGIFLMLAWYVHPVFTLGSIACLLLAYRTARIGVFVYTDCVVVRNVVRSRRVRWGEIARFDWGVGWRLFPSGGVLSFPVGCVYLRDGGFVRAFALNPPFELERGQGGAVPRALAELNDELARARAAGLAGAPDALQPVESTPAGRSNQLTFDA